MEINDVVRRREKKHFQAAQKPKFLQQLYIQRFLLDRSGKDTRILDKLIDKYDN